MAPFIRFASRRSVVHSTKGMVACTQPLAAAAGVEILRKGGNAAVPGPAVSSSSTPMTPCQDASVAVAAALNVTEPTSTGLGGDMFCLAYDAAAKSVRALNGSGRTGGRASLEQIRRDLRIPPGEVGAMPLRSVHTVTVPGAAAGWVDCVEKLGSGKLSLGDILAPAIDLAENGFPVSEISARLWKEEASVIKNVTPNYTELLKERSGEWDAPEAGELMRLPCLAHTFKLLAKYGKKGFYEGAVAEAIVTAVSQLGGHLNASDLARHAALGSEETKPVCLTFTGHNIGDFSKGVNVWEHPPNGQGIVALMALGILQELQRQGKIPRWTDRDHNTSSYLHAIIEALRIAFADGSWFVADPTAVPVPTQELLSSAYLAERAKLFDPSHRNASLQHGSPAHSSCDTVYFCVSDSSGNAVSFINSTYCGFGTGIIPQGCGFALQNRGANFRLEEGHPNSYAPNKRPYHTIIPALVTHARDDSLHSVYGVMGGFMQPQGHVQVLLNQLVFGMNPQEALDAPRLCLGSGMPELGRIAEPVVHLEQGISDAVAQELRSLGHNVQFVDGYERGMFGRGQIIRRCSDTDSTYHDPGNVLIWSAASDMRGDGHAVPV